MTGINLLPWREKKREQAKKLVVMMLILNVMAGFLLVFCVNYYALTQVENQMMRNQLLQKEINSQEKHISEISRIKQAQQVLIARMSEVHSS